MRIFLGCHSDQLPYSIAKGRRIFYTHGNESKDGCLSIDSTFISYSLDDLVLETTIADIKIDTIIEFEPDETIFMML